VKPEFWESEKIAALSFPTRLLALALLNYSDDDGYFKAHPNLVKAACFPLDDSLNIHGMLDELSQMGWVRLGKADDGVQIGHVLSFKEHQRIDKPTKSKLADKSITWYAVQESSSGTQGSLLETSRQEQGTGNREQGKEQGTSVPDGTVQSLPDCPHQRIVDLYHEILPNNPRVLRWGNDRQGHLRQRWREQASVSATSEGYKTVEAGIAWWATYFAFVAKSDFLTGKKPGREGKAPFVATLDWLLLPGKFSSVLEGKYHEAKS
jgi:hypothetical protein